MPGLRRSPRPTRWRFDPHAASMAAIAPASVREPAPLAGPSRIAASGSHPLAEEAVTRTLQQRSAAIAQAFEAIEPAVEDVASRQFEHGFAARAYELLQTRLGVSVPEDALLANWKTPLDGKALLAHAVIGTFRNFIDGSQHRSELALSDGEPVDELIQRWGFHAVDISPCADGRLAGLLDHILRVPPAIVTARRSYAGAMFDVEESLARWEEVELRRWREGRPNDASAPTRYLKVGVYHYSSLDPHHEGCAAHGSDRHRAAAALLQRLQEFSDAVVNKHGEDAGVATLLVGVDTDFDAIRVHVPDAHGRTDIGRYVDAGEQHTITASLPRETAKEAIRDAVARCAGVGPDDAASEGMRWFAGYLVKNNIAQIDAVQRTFGGAYPDNGHTERLIVVGDSVDDVQLRNLAFQAQMGTVEEGTRDLDVGVKILSGLYHPQDLAVPVLVHVQFDSRTPGAEQRAEERAERMAAAIRARYAAGCETSAIVVETLVRAEEHFVSNQHCGLDPVSGHEPRQERLQ